MKAKAAAVTTAPSKPAPAKSVPTVPPSGQVSRSGRLSDERLAWYLWNYEEWYHNEGEFAGTGEGRSSTSSAMRVSGSTEFDAMYIAMRRRCAEAVSAIIESLPTAEKIACAIKHHDAPIRMLQTRRSLEDHYNDAREMVRAALLRRGFE